jgi:hypothetical protein
MKHVAAVTGVSALCGGHSATVVPQRGLQSGSYDAPAAGCSVPATRSTRHASRSPTSSSLRCWEYAGPQSSETAAALVDDGLIRYRRGQVEVEGQANGRSVEAIGAGRTPRPVR